MSARAARAAAVAACLLLSAGCSSTSPGGKASPHPRPSRTTVASPSSVALQLRPPDWSLFPDKDTPIASAPASIAAAWAGYGVTAVPGRHVLDGVQATPPVRNLTEGAVSDEEAQLWAAGEMRTEGYVGWMEANGQPGFNVHLRTDAFLAGPIGQALRAREQVTNPNCDLYPTAIALVTIDSSIQSFFASRGLHSASKYALVMTYTPGNDPCVVTAMATPGQTPGPTPSPQPLFSVPPQGGTEIEGGALRADDLLGDIWVSDSAGDCRSGQMPSACDANQ